MPGAGSPIVVGGGIQLAGGAINEFLVLTSITPPTATTSVRWRRDATGVQLIAETATGREDTTIGIGSTNSGIAAGNLRPDVILGRNITVSHANIGANNAGVFIGQGITSAAGSGAGNIIISSRGLTPTLFGSDNVIITGGAVGTNSAGGCTVINGSVTGGVTSNLVCIGQAANANANGVVIVGQNASASQANNVSIGQSVSTTAARSIAMGQGIGSPNADMITIGHGGQNAGTAGQIKIGNGIDPNGVGANEICMGNEGLGGGGNFTLGFRYGQNQHTSGVACPAYVITHKSALGTDIAAGNVTYNLPKATGNAVPGAYIIQTAIPGASGATLQTNAEVARFSPGTATQPRNFQISQDKGLWFINQTSGAGAGLGTLTNAPTAGDPTHWLRVRINGTDMFIPCWP